MYRDTLGYWTARLEQAKAGMRYLFRLDGTAIYPDPASVCQPEGVHGASELANLMSFKWTDTGWRGITLENMIIYELHVGTFSPEGNFNGIIKRLDYLKHLGVNAIELMPVAQFPGKRNWGYDGVYPFAVQHSYGGPSGLKALVNAAHNKGIAVILDVVYNHLGPEGNYLSCFGPYFTGKYKTPWSEAMNFDDAYSYGTRNMFLQNALFWLDEFRVDALRLDAVHAIWDNSAKHFLEEMKEKVCELEKKSGRKKILIAELDLNNPRYINSREKGGLGLDGQWVDEFHHAVHAVITKETDGYYEDFGTVEQIRKAFRDTYVYTGEFSPHRKKNFGVPVTNDFSQFVVFMQNHDQVGNRMLGDRLATSLSYEALKLLAVTLLASPYVPLIFMGEEYGEKNPFLFFASHSEPKLKEQVRKGRREEFSCFNWQDDLPDPFSEENYNKCKLSWNYEGDTEQACLFKLYRLLIHLRKQHPAFKRRTRDSLSVHKTDADEVVLIERRGEDTGVLIVLNFDEHPVVFTSPDFRGKKILDTSKSDWKGPGHNGSNEINPCESLRINGLSAMIFERINKPVT
jgi:maltooligosyltrehalose trehalohydrolase